MAQRKEGRQAAYIKDVKNSMSGMQEARPENRLEQTPIKLDHALEWRLRLSAQAKGCLGNPRFSAFGCCSNDRSVGWNGDTGRNSRL